MPAFQTTKRRTREKGNAKPDTWSRTDANEGNKGFWADKGVLSHGKDRSPFGGFAAPAKFRR